MYCVKYKQKNIIRVLKIIKNIYQFNFLSKNFDDLFYPDLCAYALG